MEAESEVATTLYEFSEKPSIADKAVLVRVSFCNSCSQCSKKGLGIVMLLSCNAFDGLQGLKRGDRGVATPAGSDGKAEYGECRGEIEVEIVSVIKMVRSRSAEHVAGPFAKFGSGSTMPVISCTCDFERA